MDRLPRNRRGGCFRRSKRAIPKPRRVGTKHGRDGVRSHSDATNPRLVNGPRWPLGPQPAVSRRNGETKG